MRNVADLPEPAALSAEELRKLVRNSSEADYQLNRKALAEKTGLGVGALDAIRAEERKTATASPKLPTEELWPVPVDGDRLLDAVAFQLARYVVAEKPEIDACALWILHAHAHDAFEVSPLLLISSPVKGCGKSTLLDVIETLVPRPPTSASSSAAALYRSTGDSPSNRPTILCDEADLFFADDRNLVAFFNAGHRRGVPFRRVEGQETRRVVAFDSWAPKVLAQIGMPKWPTVVDRSIVIRLRRKGPGEQVEKFRKSHAHPDLVDLRRQAARWAADHLEQLRHFEPELPASLDNRAADNWEPLFAIAHFAGGAWLRFAQESALALKHDDDDMRLELLADLRAVFASDASLGFWPTRVVIERLLALEERPYGTLNNGKPINDHWLSRRLKGFELYSKQERREDGTKKKDRGWHVAEFRSVFDAYLQALPPSEAIEASETAEPSPPPSVAPATSDASLASIRRSERGGGSGASPSYRIAPLAPGPLRDEFEELSGKLESEGMDRGEAELQAARNLGLLLPVRT